MKKKFIILTAVVLVMAGCSASSTEAATRVEKVSTATISKVEQPLWNGSSDSQLLQLVEEQSAKQKLSEDTTRLQTVVGKLKKHVGKTWYVFSGSTPGGWDCSGLVFWFYEQLGIELHHSASAEKNAGTPHKYSESKAKVGDIIAFGWKGYDGAQHVGIYIGDGMMIHAGGGRGERTEIVNVQKWAKGNGNTSVTYTRLIETE